ncbi:MAG: phosphodiester glycosidase family protein [Nocardioides sp.]
MRNRLTLSAVLATCALITAGPALAGAPTGQTHPQQPDQQRGLQSGQQRELHPEHTSGGEPGTFTPRLPAAGRATTTSQVSWDVAPGVTYTKFSQTDARGPIRAHLLTVDPRTPGLKVDYASLRQVRSGSTVTKLVSRDRAVAGVNGDFFDIGQTGAPLGLGRDRGRGLVHARQQGWNNAFFIARNGKARIGPLPMTARVVRHPEVRVTNLNSPFVTPGGVGVYTPRWGRTAGYRATQGQRQQVRQVTVAGNGRVVQNRRKLSTDKQIRGLVLVGRGGGAATLRRELPKGTRVEVTSSLPGNPRMAISGNVLLVNEGIIRVVDDRELHPRTAVGVDSDTGEVLLLVVDGRSSRSRGYTMVELADLMVDLGADEALNLDGGGSSTMVGRNRKGAFAVLNKPSDGQQRRVANAISVRYRAP